MQNEVLLKMVWAMWKRMVSMATVDMIRENGG